MRNKQVKQMICDVHNKKYNDKCYFYNGEFGRMNYNCDPSITEMHFGRVLFRMELSITANQLNTNKER